MRRFEFSRWKAPRGLLLAAVLFGSLAAAVPAATAGAAGSTVVTLVTPDYGPLSGGTVVTISGSGFTGATAVDFGGAAATNVTVNSDTSVTATSPASPSSLTVDVTVTAGGATSAISGGDQFTYTGHVAPANNFIVSTGSQATYTLNQQFNDLFNSVPGCALEPEAVQELDFSCVTTGSGADLLQYSTSDSYLDNPINDVAVSEPAIGSSNGIKQLEMQGAHGAGSLTIRTAAPTPNNPFAINYATSARVPSPSKDDEGLNFVSYAEDGESWFHFTKTSAGKTDSGSLVSLTGEQLYEIYDGVLYNWAQLGAKTSQPIIVYSAPEGSGALSTWATFLDQQSGASSSFDPSSGSNTVNCAATAGTPAYGSKVSSTFTWPATSKTNCAGPHIILQDEDTSIASADLTNAIFYFDYGNYTLSCEGQKAEVMPGSGGAAVITVSIKKNADCGGSPLPSGDKVALGQIATSASATPVAPSAASIQNGTFPVVRDLYSVYSDGSNPNIPEATAATLNYVSEVGFLCKPQTIDGAAGSAGSADDINDPLTGKWYHTEIFDDIVANGFIPIDATVSGTTISDSAPEPEGSVNHGAETLLAAGSPAYGATYLGSDAPGQTSNTSIPTASNPLGYCQVSSTDSFSSK